MLLLFSSSFQKIISSRLCSHANFTFSSSLLLLRKKDPTLYGVQISVDLFLSNIKVIAKSSRNPRVSECIRALSLPSGEHASWPARSLLFLSFFPFSFPFLF